MKRIVITMREHLYGAVTHTGELHMFMEFASKAPTDAKRIAKDAVRNGHVKRLIPGNIYPF